MLIPVLLIFTINNKIVAKNLAKPVLPGVRMFLKQIEGTNRTITLRDIINFTRWIHEFHDNGGPINPCVGRMN